MTTISGAMATPILTGPRCNPNQTSPDSCYARGLSSGLNSGKGGQMGLVFREHAIF